jgi:hypothetical protein
MQKTTSVWSRVLVAVLGAAVLFSGCAHSARITTEPEDADVFVNGIPLGKSPRNFLSRSGLPTVYYVRIEKPGYKTLKDITIESTYRADASLVLLLFAIVPYFFSARLEDQYVWPLSPDGTQPTAPAAGAAPAAPTAPAASAPAPAPAPEPAPAK